MNSTACRSSSEFAAKSEDFQYQLVRMGTSRKYKEGWFFQTTLVKEVWNQSRTFPYAGGVLPQGKDHHKKLRGDLGDSQPRPQIVQRPNEIRREKACSPRANPTVVDIRLSRGLLAEVIKSVHFC